MRSPEEHRQLVEEYLGELAMTPELGALTESMRYALEGGGKRVRPVICLATGGQYLDSTGQTEDLAALRRLKTGCLFYASVACGLWAADIPEAEQGPWRAFAEELGLLFQIVDDILDDDGYVLTHGADGARM